jgi:Domain of unknown function (DUF932)
MTNKVETDDRSYLIKAALPEATDSYTVIPHELIINTIESVLEEKEFTITKEVYKYNMNAQIAYGICQLNVGDDPDVGMMFAWVNSYNKQVKFRCTVGGFTRIGEAAIIAEKENSSFVRKHTGTADEEVVKSIKDQLEKAFEHYKQIVDDKNAMKEILVERKEFTHLLGEMYILDKKISSEQLNISVREFWKPTFEYGDELTLWVAYNHILQGVLKCHPAKWMAQQKAIHTYLIAKYNIGMESDLVSEEQLIKEGTLTNEPQMERVDPMSDEEKEARFDVDIQHLTADEILHKYGHTLTNDQIDRLSEHRAKEAQEVEEVDQSDVEAAAEKFDEIQKEEDMELLKPSIDAAKEEEENLVEVNGKKIHVKTALDDKKEAEAEASQDEPKFMTMGKLTETSPGFYKGLIINIEDQYYEIGESTVSGGLPGHWLIAIDKPSQPAMMQGGVAEEEEEVAEEVVEEEVIVEEIVEEEEQIVSTEIIEDEDDEFNIEQPVIAIVEEEELSEDQTFMANRAEAHAEELKQELEEETQPEFAIGESKAKVEPVEEEQPEQRPESEAPKKMGFLPPQQNNKAVGVAYKPAPNQARAEEVMKEIVTEKVEEAIKKEWKENATSTETFLPEHEQIEEVVSEEPKATEEVVEALSKGEVTLPVEGKVLEEEGDEETAAAIAVSKEAVPSAWKPLDTPAKPDPNSDRFTPAGPILDQKDIKIIPPEGQEDPARQIIQKHLHELYGEIKEFTFKVTDDQYNIVLASKETICLTKKFIQNEIAESLKEV